MSLLVPPVRIRPSPAAQVGLRVDRQNVVLGVHPGHLATTRARARTHSTFTLVGPCGLYLNMHCTFPPEWHGTVCSYLI